MAEQLNAYLEGALVGTFARERGRVAFDYADSWDDRVMFSASLPTSRRHHDGPAPLNYLENLLPDDADTIDRWVRTMPDARAANPLSILAYVGLDTAGGAQFTVGELPTARESGVDPVDEHDIAEHIRGLRTDPTTWLLPTEHRGKISLAGAQAKFALKRTADGWAVPYGDEATTHIFKPGVSRLRDLDIIEHLSQSTARRVGLDAANSAVMAFEDQSVIVIERYDRAMDGDAVRRIHQEDLCQAAGVSPRTKYESDGGPGIEDVARIIRDLVPGRRGLAEVEGFLRANAYNWLIAGTDAHAKNYSLLHTDRGTRLAPLYDIASILPYEKSGRGLKLAMKVDSSYEIRVISSRHWERVAGRLGLDATAFIDWVRTTNQLIPDAVSDASAELRSQGILDKTSLVDRLAERSARVAAELNRLTGT